MQVYDFLLDSSRRFSDAEVLVASGERFTYADLHQASTSLAASLEESGVEPGDRVAVLTDIPFDYIVSYFGILLAGGVFVGLNTQTSQRTVSALLCDSGTVAILTHRKFFKFLPAGMANISSLKLCAAPGGASLAGIACRDFSVMIHPGVAGRFTPSAVDSTAPAQIMYTSGTTGKPKGVILTHANLLANTRSTIQYLGLTEHDSAMVVMPFFYSYGNSVMLTHVAVGGKLVVNQSLVYPNLIIDQMLQEKVTGLPGVPSTFSLLLHKSTFSTYRFPALRYVTQAGGGMSPALLRELADVLDGVPIYVMYGQTEASPRLSFLEPADLFRKPGSIGKAIPGVTLEVLSPDGSPVKPGETGELVATGENVMAGYWQQPEATAEVLRDGKLWTGDLAVADDEGFLYLVGRKTEMIKSGAHRITPKEIEDVLLEHRAVLESAVIGISDEILGELILACVVLKQSESCTAGELIRHCREILPSFKVPHRIEFCADFPRTDSGKIRKPVLKSRFSVGCEG